MAAPADPPSIGDGAAEPEPERMPTPEDKYNSQVAFTGARLEILPLYSQVVPGFVNKVPILFQFVTGQHPSPTRDPFTLVVVLDVSGSMMGSKLTNSKTAMAQLIESTDDNDLLSLVAYSSGTSVIFETVRCGDAGTRKNMREKVGALEANGGTDLYGGLLAGYDLLQQQGNVANKHIFLLSDGQVTEGTLQSTDAILKAVDEWDEKIPIISYGIGDDFNEKLMSPLGQVHRGSHYFYIVDAASVETLIAKGVRALTGAVARNVRLCVRPLTGGLWFPEHMIDGAFFPLVRERSVIQLLVELEARPEMPPTPVEPVSSAPSPSGWPCARRNPPAMAQGSTRRSASQGLSFAWSVHGFPLLQSGSGEVVLMPAAERGAESGEVRTFLDVRRGCELRRGAAGSPEARLHCEQALRLFEGRLECDRLGFAAEWAKKTRDLLNNESLWRGGTATGAAAKHLGVSYSRQAVEEEEEEEEMDFDLFG